MVRAPFYGVLKKGRSRRSTTPAGPLLLRASPLLADMPSAFDCCCGGHHGPFGVPDLEVGPGLLHLTLPVAFGIGGDKDFVQAEPHFHGPAPLGTQSVIRRPTDAVAKAELWKGVCDPFERMRPA